MSDLAERLRTHFKGYDDKGIGSSTFDIMKDAAAHIEALEAALQQSVDDWRERGRHIEALEAALAEWRGLAIQWAKDNDAALAPEQDIGCGKSVIEPWSAPEQDK